MQPDQDERDQELLLLAQLTSCVADSLPDAALSLLVRAIAEDVRAMADWTGQARTAR